jgi:hypothetical protein
MRLKHPYGGKTLEQRIAERQAGLPPLKPGRVFEHAPARFVFIMVLTTSVLFYLLVLVMSWMR